MGRIAKAEAILRRHDYKLSAMSDKNRKKLDDLVTKGELKDLMSFRDRLRKSKRKRRK